ncbi:SpoU rRNA Methylase family [Seminavis robusta]|uniref:SpoU rRNA Methylase family n=1 Tax=Seminavis robusta TaxID=568900 RepID=A0A9N8E3P7_9STRA|nr:SpoU rRNA Methylase family [Seminavis robusta]|eukprot:Sro586_g171130.1 SpoU rRNA Methylase family (458) ;mRNA; r:17895-19268
MSSIPLPTKHFLLGFATALSAVWVSQRLMALSASSSTRNTKSSRSPTKDATSTSNNDKEQDDHVVMDTPDLDQRMIRKAEAVIQWRTARITVVVERCTNDFNYSAILRTAEALGVQHVWIIDPPLPPTLAEDTNGDIMEVPTKENAGRPVPTGQFTPQELKGRAMHHIFARGAGEWLTVREFQNTTDCIQALKETNHTLWVTDLSQQAVCLTRDVLLQQQQSNNNDSHDPQQSSSSSSILPPKLAIVFGTEAVGCSEELLQAADLRVYLPLRGFADSLNLSVATALVLHQLFVLDPTIVGDMPPQEQQELRQTWFTKLCQQRLMTPKQKKTRGRLQLAIQQCDKIQAKEERGELVQPGERKKLNQKQQFLQELADLERTCRLDDQGTRDLQTAIADLVQHPPAPLTDMRRADNHRVCFVGKNTKKKHQEHWKDMVATSNADTKAQHSASFFRERVFG